MAEAISKLSKEYLYVPLTVNVAPEMFTSPVSMALSKTADPGTFYTAEYVPEKRAVRMLVGPNSAIGALTPGRYFVYVKIDDAPEDPVKTATSHINVY